MPLLILFFIPSEKIKVKKSTIEELKRRGIIDNSATQICDRCLAEAGFETGTKNNDEKVKPPDEVMETSDNIHMVDEVTQTEMNHDYYSFENRFKRIGKFIP